MARRKKKSPGSGKFFKSFVIILFIAFVGVVAVQGSIDFLTTSSYFRIKDIAIDPEFDFMNVKYFESFKGKNIFKADLGSLQTKLKKLYPQVKDVKLVKRYPDQIALKALKRKPYAQIKNKTRKLLVTEEGIVISSLKQFGGSYPVIEGFDDDDIRTKAGQRITNKNAQLGLRIVKTFVGEKGLKNYKIKKVNVDNLSKIECSITGDYKVIIDRDNIGRKFDMLALVLSQAHPELKEVKYIDLRFKEPVLGKK